MPPSDSLLSRIYLENYREIVDFLSLRTGCRHAAQDCAQDCWFKLCKARPAEPVDNSRSYVFRVAANIAVDWHRSNGRELRLQADYAASGDPTATSPDTLETVQQRRNLERLEAIIRALPPRTVEVFVLNRLEGLTYTETAKRLGISASAVEKHIARVLLQCLPILEEM